ncbi:hypothetical protein R5R35_005000 [Gryllus longicercus]|uniref:Uncharacterized protein n=1 Tax=Gryllus longicercus TaxID=2509291 RepID=A0AAN9Z072_9ORTH
MSEVELQQLQEPSQTPQPPSPPPPSPASTPSPDGSEIDGVNPPPSNVFHWSSGGAEDEEEEEGEKTRRKGRKKKQKEGECTTQCDLHCKTKPKRIKRRSSLNRKPTDKRRVIRGRLQQQKSLTGEAAGVNVTQCARNAAEWLARAVFTLCDDNKNNSVIEKYMSDDMYLPLNL